MIAEIKNGKIKHIIIGQTSCLPNSGQIFVPDNWGVKEIKSLAHNCSPNTESYLYSISHDDPEKSFQLMSLTDDMNYFSYAINLNAVDEEFELMEIV